MAKVSNVKFVTGPDGKVRIERVHKFRSVSSKIAARKSKKQRPVSRSAASQMDLMLGRRGK
jgi:hypothetical protein